MAEAAAAQGRKPEIVDVAAWRAASQLRDAVGMRKVKKPPACLNRLDGAGIKGKCSHPELPNSQENTLPALCHGAMAGSPVSSKPLCSPAHKQQWDRQEHTASSQALHRAMSGSGKPLGCRMEKGAWCRQEALNWREQLWHASRQWCHTHVPKRSWEPASSGAMWKPECLHLSWQHTQAWGAEL